MPFDRTNDLLERAYRVIPSASQTFSKGPNQWARGVSPHFLERGEGAWVWDVDGNKYLDWLMALGPVSLGYRFPETDAAIADQLGRGATFSQMNRLEVEVAEMLVDRIPCAEMVRFGKNGSDATTAAVRIARAVTGRKLVAACGYHGWHDWYIASTSRHLGIPEEVRALTKTFAYNDAASLERLFAQHPGQIACVVMEGVSVELPKPGFLEAVAAATKRHGALLVFDEIVAGFRIALAGAQERFGVTPDLACFGKAMANGMPLAAVVGRREPMEAFDRIFFSGTFGGECLSLAAGKATMEAYDRYKVVDHIWRTGTKLLDGTERLVADYQLGAAIKTLGMPPRSILAFPHEDERESRIRRTYFMQECVKRGLLYMGVNNASLAHGDGEVAFTLGVFGEVMPLFRDALAAGDFERRLAGPPTDPIFRRI
jgi:glutamate-1-semialdehyde aminotransferase